MEERRDRRQQRRDDKYERRLAEEEFWAEFDEQIDRDRTEAYEEDRRRTAEKEAKGAMKEPQTHAAPDGTEIPIDAPWRDGQPVSGQPQGGAADAGKPGKKPYRRVWDRVFAPMGAALREPFEGLPDPRRSIRRGAAAAADATREGIAGLRATARPFVPVSDPVPSPVPSGTGLPRPPSVVPRRPTGPVRLDQLRQPTRPDPTLADSPSVRTNPTRPITGGTMFGITDAAQALSAWNPDTPEETKSALMSLPGELRDLGAGLTAMAENLAGNYPYASSIADTIRDLGAAVSATESSAEDAAMAFVREHEADLQRHEAPRPNEAHWNV